MKDQTLLLVGGTSSDVDLLILVAHREPCLTPCLRS